MRLWEGCSCYISLGKKEGIESFHIISGKGDARLRIEWNDSSPLVPSLPVNPFSYSIPVALSSKPEKQCKSKGMDFIRQEQGWTLSECKDTNPDILYIAIDDSNEPKTFPELEDSIVPDYPNLLRMRERRLPYPCWGLWLPCLIPFTSQGQDESIALPSKKKKWAPIDSIEGIKAYRADKERISLYPAFRSHFLLKEDRKKLKVEKEGSDVYEQNEPQIEKADQGELQLQLSIGVLRWERNNYKLLVQERNLSQFDLPALTYPRLKMKSIPQGVADLALLSLCQCSSSHPLRYKALRKKIDNCILGSTGDPTRWNKALPIKINIHIWRLIQDRLPTRCNLDNRGIDIHSKRCPVCDEDLETTQHLFVDCFLAKSLWKKISSWWGFSDYPKLLLDLIAWGDSTNLSKSLKTTTNVQDDTRKSQEYLSNLTIEFNDKALLAGHRRFFEIYGTIVATKHHEKGLDVGSYDWDEEKLSSED
ncbi:RNA-directed DNA polymerase, eukaryota, reverse transcriptase zinc-binding domain protein [Tanacetum coccineum]